MSAAEMKVKIEYSFFITAKVILFRMLPTTSWPKLSALRVMNVQMTTLVTNRSPN